MEMDYFICQSHRWKKKDSEHEYWICKHFIDYLLEIQDVFWLEILQKKKSF